MKTEIVLRNYLHTFGVYNEDIDFLLRLEEYFGDAAYRYVEEAIKEAESEYRWISYNLEQGNAVLQGIQEVVIAYLVYNLSEWDIADWDGTYATLKEDKLHAYTPHLNRVQEFLVEEGVIGNEERLIKALKKKQAGSLTVPVFEALDGTEYLAVENLLPEWSTLSEIEDGVTPLHIVKYLDLEEAQEVLDNEEDLKRLLAQAV